VWLVDHWVRRRRARRAAALGQAKASPALEQGAPGPKARQPVSWPWLYLTALIAALSHLLLDWTNNYGLRPFFPFNPRWYAGSFVFIAEPVLWLLLGSALVIPGLLGLIGERLGAQGPVSRAGWAIFALTGMVLVWAGAGPSWAMRGLCGKCPDRRGSGEAHGAGALSRQPFRWHAILETADFYQTAEIDTLSGEIVSDPRSM